MQFRLHINNTTDGTVIARELRRLANMFDGQVLSHGIRRDLEGGYATMDCGHEVYESCAEAERKLGFTLTWRDDKMNREHHGYWGSAKIATVKMKEGDARDQL